MKKNLIVTTETNVGYKQTATKASNIRVFTDVHGCGVELFVHNIGVSGTQTSVSLLATNSPPMFEL